MANYIQMKKEELIKVLKERDADIDTLTKEQSRQNSVIAGFEETNKTLVRDNDDLTVKVSNLTSDLKKANEVSKRLNDENEALKTEKCALKTTISSKDDIIASLKTQRIVLGTITLAAILIAIIF